MPKRIDKKILEQLDEMIRAGKSSRECIESLGVSLQTYYRHRNTIDTSASLATPSRHSEKETDIPPAIAAVVAHDGLLDLIRDQAVKQFCLLPEEVQHAVRTLHLYLAERPKS